MSWNVFKQHPAGLPILFFSELWERFSFYGMRALLKLYMGTPVKGSEAYKDYVAKTLAKDGKPNPPGFGMTKKDAYGVYAAYGTLVYAFPFFGGKLADSILGYRRAIMIGAVLMAIGHFTMGIETPIFFYGSLGLIALGNGFFKPNISSLVGKLYSDNDPRRDGGFTIFYMGINIGAAIAPVMCGYLANKFGWHWGFGLAGIGMLVGLVWFYKGRAKLEGRGEAPKPETVGKSQMIIVAAAILLIPVSALGMYYNQYVSYILYTVGIVVLGILIWTAFREEKVGRDRLLVIVVLIFFHALFWAFFEQAGSSLTDFTEENVNRRIFGTEIPTAMFQAVNPSYIMLLAIPFSILWLKLSKANRNPSIPMKFSLGIVQLGVGFFALVWGASLANEQSQAPLFSLLLSYFLQTTGELCLSPVGLSAVTKLAPQRAVGMVMGAWFLSVAFAHNLAGIVAKLTTVQGAKAATATAADTLARYSTVFQQVAMIALGAGIFLALISPLLRKMTHGVD